MVMKHILYRLDGFSMFFPSGNSNANCRKICAFADNLADYSGTEQTDPNCAIAQKDVTETVDEMNDATFRRTLAVDATDPTGPFLVPDAADVEPV